MERSVSAVSLREAALWPLNNYSVNDEATLWTDCCSSVAYTETELFNSYGKLLLECPFLY